MLFTTLVFELPIGVSAGNWGDSYAAFDGSNLYDKLDWGNTYYSQAITVSQNGSYTRLTVNTTHSDPITCMPLFFSVVEKSTHSSCVLIVYRVPSGSSITDLQIFLTSNSESTANYDFGNGVSETLSIVADGKDHAIVFDISSKSGTAFSQNLLSMLRIDPHRGGNNINKGDYIELKAVAVCGSKKIAADYADDKNLCSYGISYEAYNQGTLFAYQDNTNNKVDLSLTTPAAPSKTGYDFAGWTVKIDNNLHSDGDKTVTGVAASTTFNFSGIDIYKYEEKYQKSQHIQLDFTPEWTPKSYTITWANYDGNGSSKTSSCNYDSTPSYSGTPQKSEDNYRTYSFSKWSPSITKCTGNATYTAQFSTSYKSFTITYNTNGGSLSSSSQTYSTGTAFTLATPTRSGYKFTGWTANGGGNWGTGSYSAGQSIDSLKRYGNVTLTANWEADNYTITWQNEDGSTFDTTTVSPNTVPTHEGPTKAEDNYNTYTFNAWTPTPVAATANATYKATFTSNPKTYTITYMDGDTSLGTQSYTTNAGFSLANTPTKEGYTFNGWVADNAGNWGTSTYTAGQSLGATDKYGNVTLTAQWTKNTYTVTWKDGDGNTLKTDTVEHGATPSYTGENPTKTATDLCEYEWTGGWDPAVSSATGNVTYTATFYKVYTVTWKNENGDLIKTDKVKENENPTAPTPNPTKEEDNLYTYTFKEWSPAVAPATEHVTYTATYTSTPKTYTITYTDGESQIGDAQSYTTDIAFTLMSAPEKEGYDFAGWKVVTASGSWIENATFTDLSVEAGQYGNVTLSAQWTVKTYTITWQDDEGNVIDTTVVNHGEVPAHADPVKDSTDECDYVFKGWSPVPEAATADATYSATFEEVKKAFTITWVNYDGTVLETDEDVPYGTKPSYDGATPEKADEDGIAYLFDGWDPDPESTITENKTYTAKFIEQYTITYVFNGGESTSGWYTEKYTKKDAITLPNVLKQNCEFLGWTVSDATDDSWTSDPIVNNKIPLDVTGFKAGVMNGNVTLTAEFRLLITDLVIEADGTEKIDENQSYIFDITDGNGYSLTVCIVGSAEDGEASSVTIKDIPMGTYTVTEQDGWSWRYANADIPDSSDDNAITVTLTDNVGENTVTFEFVRTKKPQKQALWLGGDSYKKNRYGAFPAPAENDENKNN